MKKYNFLFKPLFFIFSLIFATGLVLYIEKISPSDLGKYESLFKSRPKEVEVKTEVQNPEKEILPTLKLRQINLKKICTEYKAGLIDSTKLDEQLDSFMKNSCHELQ